MLPFRNKGICSPSGVGGMILILATILLYSCGPKKQEVAHFSNELTAINDSLFYTGKAWGEEFRIAFNTGDYSGLSHARIQMQAYIDRNIGYIDSMKDVGDSHAFRQAELSFLRFEKDTIVSHMQVFETFTDTTTHDAINAAYSHLLSTARMEQAKLEELRRVQKAYADKYHIKLQPSSLSLVE
jgi:hypothetical protein